MILVPAIVDLCGSYWPWAHTALYLSIPSSTSAYWQILTFH